MNRKRTKTKTRLHFLSWLVIPVVVAWFGVSYIVGRMHIPKWQSEKMVLGQSTISNGTDFPKPVQGLRFFSKPEHGFITFWFDDAWASQYDQTQPVLEPKGYKASLAVPTKSIWSFN